MKERVQQGQTLLNICQRMSQQMDQMALIIQTLTGKDMGAGGTASGQSGGGRESGQSSGGGGSFDLAGAVQQAQTPMTDYGTRLAERSTPDMNNRSSGAAPQ